MPNNGPYITNITRATVLVCNPQIQFMPKTAQAFGRFIELSSVEAAYRAGIGNMDPNFMSYMVYNYAAQQALSTIGTFRSYLVFSEATGNAIFAPDPVNPDGGTVPKSTIDIANTLVNFIFCHSLLVKAHFCTTSERIYSQCKQNLDNQLPCTINLTTNGVN